MPIGILPEWNSAKPDPTFKAEWWKRPAQVVKASRTVGMVRVPIRIASSSMISKRDPEPHPYDWNMVLNDDLTLGSAKLMGDAKAPQGDIVINEMTPVSPAPRHLLVRVLRRPP